MKLFAFLTCLMIDFVLNYMVEKLNPNKLIFLHKTSILNGDIFNFYLRFNFTEKSSFLFKDFTENSYLNEKYGLQKKDSIFHLLILNEDAITNLNENINIKCDDNNHVEITNDYYNRDWLSTTKYREFISFHLSKIKMENEFLLKIRFDNTIANIFDKQNEKIEKELENLIGFKYFSILYCSENRETLIIDKYQLKISFNDINDKNQLNDFEFDEQFKKNSDKSFYNNIVQLKFFIYFIFQIYFIYEYISFNHLRISYKKFAMTFISILNITSLYEFFLILMNLSCIDYDSSNNKNSHFLFYSITNSLKYSILFFFFKLVSTSYNLANIFYDSKFKEKYEDEKLNEYNNLKDSNLKLTTNFDFISIEEIDINKYYEHIKLLNTECYSKDYKFLNQSLGINRFLLIFMITFIFNNLTMIYKKQDFIYIFNNNDFYYKRSNNDIRILFSVLLIMLLFVLILINYFIFNDDFDISYTKNRKNLLINKGNSREIVKKTIDMIEKTWYFWFFFIFITILSSIIRISIIVINYSDFIAKFDGYVQITEIVIISIFLMFFKKYCFIRIDEFNNIKEEFMFVNTKMANVESYKNHKYLELNKSDYTDETDASILNLNQKIRNNRKIKSSNIEMIEKNKNDLCISEDEIFEESKNSN